VLTTFFNTPLENVRIYAEAAQECAYFIVPMTPSLDEINEDIYLILKLGGYYKRGVKNPCKVGA